MAERDRETVVVTDGDRGGGGAVLAVVLLIAVLVVLFLVFGGTEMFSGGSDPTEIKADINVKPTTN
ncbi:MAG TPA: hypothetical protein VGC46_06895 [Allosphingosinicella sp.]|uniref:hypothetical protein n=1 Tax=Sphingosinicella sp. YJ22 TaxID=1104780 RepID=UPI00140A3CA2|nr:hypothetical protein [Sphingosinicella sp. YJ22]